ncbi:hypothetical protein [Flavobacterium sp. M31R6]|uniref:hypothetical protein n=1 Tax=Flavobacterium sp. M31R6 TaxID=2739062 RepID=UPI001568250D|nr:hypothetical protein [Flavobacterium sp. M31R6]QKJ62651.1 hypothetical protein HQN62_05725 [Flavobacterium sp. M31R6]
MNFVLDGFFCAFSGVLLAEFNQLFWEQKDLVFLLALFPHTRLKAELAKQSVAIFFEPNKNRPKKGFSLLSGLRISILFFCNHPKKNRLVLLRKTVSFI